jgi:hypothetical protein
MEAESMMEKSLVDLCAQFYYGTNTTYGGNAKGFPGLLDAYDSTNNVVDAGGTTASTGSSVWLVKFGPKAVQWVWGKAAQLTMPDPRIETIYDTNSNFRSRLRQDLLARPGLQVGSIRSAVRIKKLTADSRQGLHRLAAQRRAGEVRSRRRARRDPDDTRRSQPAAARAARVDASAAPTAGRRRRRERPRRSRGRSSTTSRSCRHRRDQGHRIAHALNAQGDEAATTTSEQQRTTASNATNRGNRGKLQSERRAAQAHAGLAGRGVERVTSAASLDLGHGTFGNPLFKGELLLTAPALTTVDGCRTRAR